MYINWYCDGHFIITNWKILQRHYCTIDITPACAEWVGSNYYQLYLPELKEQWALLPAELSHDIDSHSEWLITVANCKLVDNNHAQCKQYATHYTVQRAT